MCIIAPNRQDCYFIFATVLAQPEDEKQSQHCWQHSYWKENQQNQCFRAIWLYWCCSQLQRNCLVGNKHIVMENPLTQNFRANALIFIRLMIFIRQSHIIFSSFRGIATSDMLQWIWILSTTYILHILTN